MLTAKEFFDVEVPKAFARDPAGAKAIGGNFAFKITRGTPDDYDKWTIFLASEVEFQAPRCESGTIAGDSKCTMTASWDDVMEMRRMPHVALRFYFDRRISIEGDPMMLSQNILKFFKFVGRTPADEDEDPRR